MPLSDTVGRSDATPFTHCQRFAAPMNKPTAYAYLLIALLGFSTDLSAAPRTRARRARSLVSATTHSDASYLADARLNLSQEGEVLASWSKALEDAILRAGLTDAFQSTYQEIQLREMPELATRQSILSTDEKQLPALLARLDELRRQDAEKRGSLAALERKLEGTHELIKILDSTGPGYKVKGASLPALNYELASLRHEQSIIMREKIKLEETHQILASHLMGTEEALTHIAHALRSTARDECYIACQALSALYESHKNHLTHDQLFHFMVAWHGISLSYYLLDRSLTKEHSKLVKIDQFIKEIVATINRCYKPTRD